MFPDEIAGAPMCELNSIHVAYSAAEMSAFKPVGGGFVRHAGMWLDKSAGITTGYLSIKSTGI